MKKIFLSSILFFAAVYFTGCLSVESKEYKFTLKKDKSGHGVIKYINIMSDVKDSLSSVESDYQDLIDGYLKGDRLLDETAFAKNIKKRLFEEDNQLCGEVSFDFDDITKLRFYRYKDTGPWCRYIGSSQIGVNPETYFSSNGTYGGETMPVIFWDGTKKEFNYKTSSGVPSKTTTSLLEMWKQKGEQ